MRPTRFTLTAAALLAAGAGQAAAQFEDDRLCADVNANGFVEPGDFTSWIAAYNMGNFAADTNQNGVIEPGDFTSWVSAYNMGESGPGCAVAIGGGGTVNGSISFPGDVDTFRIDARAGDDILITISEDVPTVAELRLTLTAPDGTVVETDWAFVNQRMDAFDVPADGTYELTVREFYDRDLADYTMTAIVADDTMNVGNTPIESGITRNATVTPGDIDTFSIEANAGDDLLFTMSEVGGDGDTELIVNVHGPDGELIASDWAFVNMRLDVPDVPADGTYTYVVREFYGGGTTDFRFTAVVADGRLNADNTQLRSGETVTASLEPGDIDTFSILAQQGDDLFLTIAESTAVAAELLVSIHGPAGELLSSDWAFENQRLDIADVPADGIYTIVVREFYGGDSIDFTMTALVANGGIDADDTRLTSGQTASATMTPGDIDTFTIDAQAGDDLVLAIAETPDVAMELFISIHGPSGQQLYSGWGFENQRVDLAELPADGNYTVIVREFFGGDTCDYAITAVVVDGTADAGSVGLSNGSPVAAEMLPGDIDTFTISASAGQDITVTTTETPSVASELLVSIHGPSGQLVASGWAFSELTLTADDVPASGTYTIIVREYDGGGGGQYEIAATRSN